MFWLIFFRNKHRFWITVHKGCLRLEVWLWITLQGQFSWSILANIWTILSNEIQPKRPKTSLLNQFGRSLLEKSPMQKVLKNSDKLNSLLSPGPILSIFPLHTIAKNAKFHTHDTLCNEFLHKITISRKIQQTNKLFMNLSSWAKTEF